MEDSTTTGAGGETGLDDAVGRRGFLERLAGATAGTTAAATGLAVPARADDRGRRTRSGRRGRAGVDRRTEARIERAIRQGRRREAARLLREGGVAHAAERVTMPAAGDPTGTEGRDDMASGDGGSDGGGGGGVTTQSVYDRGDSSFWMYVWSRGADVYRAYCSWELRASATAWIDGSGPDDGVGITVSEDHWEPVIGSWAFGDHTRLDERGALGVIGRFDDAQPACGAFACEEPSRERRSGWQRVDLRKKEPGSHNVYGSYVHTWNPWSVPGWAEFALAVGPISLKASGNVHSWTRRSDMNI